jgi:hypothetical protein
MTTITQERPQTKWRSRLDGVFQVLEERRASALQQMPVDEEDFRWFVQSVGIPAFRQFRDALAEHGEKPEYAESEDWVAFRWPDGHTVGISPLLRAPSRATAAMQTARTHRRLHGETDLSSIQDLMQEDVLIWLVRHYATWKRVADAEILGHPSPAGSSLGD